ncbi:hypothetical protein JBKA6_0591 [Ichthyobacterium seriolicida]|uniref:Thioesterase n=2 Tax=Ichthyobacterium seriolicida TaxID=242600 RepID=A0A1J1E3I0_9FLAO|nr:hypothetical protein JBKA6_0591 [Ichthyobacterium seriolicida]
MYWAVQGMASELSTGVLLMKYIKRSHRDVSMLVIGQKGSFMKKARGRITFTCLDGNLVKEAISKSISTGEPQKINMVSEGVDQDNNTVSKFEYQWSIKVK